jgi:uncharacterized protein (TIGR03067 family)
MTRFAFLLLVCAAPLVAAPVPKALKKKTTPEGVWEAVEDFTNGQRVEHLSWKVWVIDGEQLRIFADKDVMQKFTNGEKLYHCHYQLQFNVPDDPTAFELVAPAFGKDTLQMLKGRMKLEGDTLALCYAFKPTDDRPTTCSPDKGYQFYSFKKMSGEVPRAK